MPKHILSQMFINSMLGRYILLYMVRVALIWLRCWKNKWKMLSFFPCFSCYPQVPLFIYGPTHNLIALLWIVGFASHLNEQALTRAADLLHFEAEAISRSLGRK